MDIGCHASTRHSRLHAGRHRRRCEARKPYSPAPGEVERELGFEAGAVGPIVTTEDTQVLVGSTDAQMLDVVYCGCERADRTLQLRLINLLSITNASVVPLIKPRSPLGPEQI